LIPSAYASAGRALSRGLAGFEVSEVSGTMSEAPGDQAPGWKPLHRER